MCFKGRMNGLPQGSVVSPGQWAEGCGENGCAQALWVGKPKETTDCLCAGPIHTISMLDSDLLSELRDAPGFCKPRVQL